MDEKIQHGQFYTIRSPFHHELFRSWVRELGGVSELSFVEPFAGSNNLIHLTRELIPFKNTQWRAYDIDPEAVGENLVPEVKLIQNDSFEHMPEADVMLTNPPYLAKNSARRMGMETDHFGEHGDLWELSVAKMIEKTKFLAAIIPESFLTRQLFQERLYGVVSITEQIFDDTDFPVCLALWVNEPREDYPVYIGEELIGEYRDLLRKSKVENSPTDELKVVFNDPDGLLGLQAVDDTKKPSIKFRRGEEIPRGEIKATSRAKTRLSVYDGRDSIIDEANLDEVIEELNKTLNSYREETGDIFLTSFKGLRGDGRYRRRLDWKKASKIIHSTLVPEPMSLF